MDTEEVHMDPVGRGDLDKNHAKEEKLVEETKRVKSGA